MKRLISLVVAIMLVMTAFGSVTFADTAVWDGTYDVSWYDANATEMHISTAEDFAGIVAIQNGTEQAAGGIVSSALIGKTVILDNDIYLNDTLAWDEDGNLTTAEPNLWSQIGNWGGIFDGNGHTIYGAYISYDEIKANDPNGYGPSYVGLFSLVWRGTVKNLTISNAYVHGGSEWKNVGVVVGRNQGGTVENVHVTNSFATGINASIGGIAGNNDVPHEGTADPGIIDGCSVDSATVLYNQGGGGSVAGIVCSNDNTNGDLVLGQSVVRNCTSAATIMGYNQIGGIIGTNNALVEDCTFTGSASITVDGNDNWCSGTGGIAGVNSINGVRKGEIKNCAVIGAYVQGKSWNGIGGIAGFNNGGSVTNCYSVGCTVANDYPSSGGIVGHNGNAGTVTNCYTNNTVTSGYNNNAGIVFTNGTATNCYYQKTDSINSTTVLTGSTVTATNCDTFDTNFVLTTSGTSVADALNAWVAANAGYNKWVMDEALGYVVFAEDDGEAVKEYPEFIEDTTMLSGFDFENETASDKYFTAFSKIYVPESYTEEVEFGIIFLSSDEALDSDAVIAGGEKYKAEGKLDDGSYAVRLMNGEGDNDYFTSAYNAFVPYLKYGTTEVYSDFIIVE